MVRGPDTAHWAFLSGPSLVQGVVKTDVNQVSFLLSNFEPHFGQNVKTRSLLEVKVLKNTVISSTQVQNKYLSLNQILRNSKKYCNMLLKLKLVSSKSDMTNFSDCS